MESKYFVGLLSGKACAENGRIQKLLVQFILSKLAWVEDTAGMQLNEKFEKFSFLNIAWNLFIMSTKSIIKLVSDDYTVSSVG